MPTFKVIKEAGVQFPVGFEFEAETLHPALAPHVQMIGKAAMAEEPEEEQEEQEEQAPKRSARKKPDATPETDPDDDNT